MELVSIKVAPFLVLTPEIAHFDPHETDHL